MCLRKSLANIEFAIFAMFASPTSIFWYRIVIYMGLYIQFGGKHYFQKSMHQICTQFRSILPYKLYILSRVRVTRMQMCFQKCSSGVRFECAFFKSVCVYTLYIHVFHLISFHIPIKSTFILELFKLF